MSIPRYLILVITVLTVAVFFNNRQSEFSPIGETSQPAYLGHLDLDSPNPENQDPIAEAGPPQIRSRSPGIIQSPAPTAPPTASTLSDLPGSEQKSLWKAFSEARREARPIPESWAQREENLGYDFYAQHPKQNLTTRFGSQGVQIVSSDRTYTDADTKNPTTAWEAHMRLLTFAGENVQPGAPAEKSEATTSRMEYRHRPELTEWYDNGIAGIEHGYTITQRPTHLPAGEKVMLEVALTGLKATEQREEDGSHTLKFVERDRTVLSYSKLLVFDANGKELPATMKPTDSGFTLAYNDAQAIYPVTVDPLIRNEGAKLNSIDAAAFDSFGRSVAIAGDSVVIGADRDDDGGPGSGSAYVFTRSDSTWSQQAKLTASDAAADDFFGSSVAIAGDSVIVGALFHGNGGSAYVFTRSDTTWSQQAKLTASDAAADDFFGSSVDIAGDSVVVGAYGNDDGGTNSGSAYVFTRSGTAWSQQAKLTANEAAGNDFFGSSVAIAGDSLVVGTDGDDDGGQRSGSAYVFIRSGTAWSRQAKLTANDAAAYDFFGKSVDISGDSVVIGASEDDDGGLSSGSAYVFTRSGTLWSQQAKLTASDAAADDFFGRSVAIAGDSVVVGAFADDDGGPGSGSAYIFTRSGTLWSRQAKLTANDAAAGDRFGFSVAISVDSVVVGAFEDDDGGSDSGSVYIYSFTVVQLLVSDHLGGELLDGNAATPFPILEVDTSDHLTFSLTNVGLANLDIVSVSLEGDDSTQFSLTLPDISSNPDLSFIESLDYTITFSPTGGTALRNATVRIVSNDTDMPSFTFTISGQGLSDTDDGDNDGMNDWAEYSLRDLGFDWEITQFALVNTLLNNASTAGLYTEAELAAVNVSGSLVEVDAATNTAAIVIGLEDSEDMETFAPIIADPSKLSIDGSGKIRYEVDTSPDKKFIRAGVSK